MNPGAVGKLENPSNQFGGWYLLELFGAYGIKETVDAMMENQLPASPLKQYVYILYLVGHI